MAMIGLKVPHETARLLASLEVPGEKVQKDHMHITVTCLEGDDLPIDVIGQALEAAYAVTSKVAPFVVSTDLVTTFPKNETTGLIPVIARVNSPELMHFQQEILKSLDRMGIPYSKKFPIYKPHVTLSYAKESFDDVVLKDFMWGAHEAMLWGGDHGDDRVSVVLPFTLTTSKKASEANMIRQVMKITNP